MAQSLRAQLAAMRRMVLGKDRFVDAVLSLPLIVTAGGPTDEFASDACAWRIPARGLVPASPHRAAAGPISARASRRAAPALCL